MSRTYGKLPHRAVAALGSACFLGTLALMAAPADAGLYLALKPTAVTTSGPGTPSFTIGGDIFTGFTLSLSAGASAATYTVSYDIVAVITDGATTNAAPNSGLFNIRGAIRGTGTAQGQALVADGGGMGTQAVLVPGTLPINASIVQANEARGGKFSTGTVGDGTLLAGQTIGSIKGVGPQFGAFGVSDSTNTSITDRSRFDLQYTTTTDDGLGLNIGKPLTVNTETVVGQARIELTGSEGQNASLQLVGPDNGGTVNSGNALGLFYENFNASNRSGSLLLLGTADSTNKALAVSFGPIGGGFVKGDFGGNATPTGIDPSLDNTLYVPDDQITGADLDAFLLFLSAPDVYELINPSLAATFQERGDFGGAATPNGIDPSLDGTLYVPDGQITGADLDAFLLFLSAPDVYQLIQDSAAGPAPALAAASSLAVVPEPAALGLLLPAVALAGRRRR